MRQLSATMTYRLTIVPIGFVLRRNSALPASQWHTEPVAGGQTCSMRKKVCRGLITCECWASATCRSSGQRARRPHAASPGAAAAAWDTLHTHIQCFLRVHNHSTGVAGLLLTHTSLRQITNILLALHRMHRPSWLSLKLWLQIKIISLTRFTWKWKCRK